MIRMSMLRNEPVVMGERQIGLLQSISLDKARKRVCALVVSCGMHGKRIVPSQHVCMIADGFILVGSQEKYRHSDKQQIWPFARDTTGLLVGRVTDYAIDRKTLDVLAIEIITGYWGKEIRNRIWLYEYSPASDADEIIIPSLFHNKSSCSTEGSEECDYQP
ncbi:MAG: hypothetical protein E7321_05020 [Clostridiales bacterium]|nr:hypothetical protein [Clostridiales bacterium]